MVSKADSYNKFNSLLILKRFRVTYLLNGWCSIRVRVNLFLVAANIVYNLLKSGLYCFQLFNRFASSRECTSSSCLKGAVNINRNVRITVLKLIRLLASKMVKLFNSVYLIILSRSKIPAFDETFFLSCKAC